MLTPNAILHVREARQEDQSLVFGWAAKPEFRASLLAPPAEWEQHLSWFRSKLRDPDCFFYIGLVDGKPVGEARFEVEGRLAVLSAAVAGEHRGKGLERELVARAAEKLFDESTAARVRTYVKADDPDAIDLFADAGFRDAGPANVRGHDAVVFELER